MQLVGSLDPFSEPPPEEPPKVCVPPQAGEPQAVDESKWDDCGRCQRCNNRLEKDFAHCPKCGLTRTKQQDPYAVVRTGIPASLPPGVSAPPKSGFQPAKKPEYSIVSPSVRHRRRRTP